MSRRPGLAVQLMLTRAQVRGKVSPPSVCICPAPWSPVNYLCFGPWRGDRLCFLPSRGLLSSIGQGKHPLWHDAPSGVLCSLELSPRFWRLTLCLSPRMGKEGVRPSIVEDVGCTILTWVTTELCECIVFGVSEIMGTCCKLTWVQYRGNYRTYFTGLIEGSNVIMYVKTCMI